MKHSDIIAIVLVEILLGISIAVSIYIFSDGMLAGFSAIAVLSLGHWSHCHIETLFDLLFKSKNKAHSGQLLLCA